MIPDTIEKIERSQFLTFLDTTPNSSTSTFALLGIGVVDYGIDFNPSVDTEKWICELNSRTDHTANQKQGSVSQKIYKNDPCFEFVEAGRDKLNYKTKILDIDTWNGTNGTYPAKLSVGKVVITKYMGSNAEMEYDLYYEGDTIDGTATISDEGVPTFSANTSL